MLGLRKLCNRKLASEIEKRDAIIEALNTKYECAMRMSRRVLDGQSRAVDCALKCLEASKADPVGAGNKDEPLSSLHEEIRRLKIKLAAKAIVLPSTASLDHAMDASNFDRADARSLRLLDEIGKLSDDRFDRVLKAIRDTEE